MGMPAAFKAGGILVAEVDVLTSLRPLVTTGALRLLAIVFVSTQPNPALPSSRACPFKDVRMKAAYDAAG